jgi:septal ring factor EnvC (AmiA/AmiB activator)
MPVMTSSLNNVTNGTVDDFFRMHRYNGEIYKTLNLQGKALAQLAATPEALKAEQEKIEKQLKDFEDHLWKQDTVIPTPSKRNKAGKTKKPASSDSGSSSVTMRDRRF